MSARLYAVREEVFPSFFPHEELKTVRPCGAGRFAASYLENGETKRCVLHRIRGGIFKSPLQMMKNMTGVSSWLRIAAEREGRNPDSEAPAVFYAEDGLPLVRAQEGTLWWCRAYAPGTRAVMRGGGLSMDAAFQAGRTMGRFFRRLSDYPVETLFDTIPARGHFSARKESFLNALEADRRGRAQKMNREINFVLALARETEENWKHWRKTLPVRVVHGSPLPFRILLDSGGNALRMDGLETVSSGFAPLDFGAAARAVWLSGPDGAAEDEALAAFTRGYLEEAGQALSPMERALLLEGIRRAALEECMRRLSAVLNGETVPAGPSGLFQLEAENGSLNKLPGLPDSVDVWGKTHLPAGYSPL